MRVVCMRVVSEKRSTKKIKGSEYTQYTGTIIIIIRCSRCQIDIGSKWKRNETIALYREIYN